MKLAEALLQDKPIKRKDFKMWCKPEIVKSDRSDYAALPTVCGMNKYTINYKNMTADDWEIKQEPMKVEFECEWLLSKRGFFYPNDVDERDILVEMYKSGKRFKVTCEEVVE